MSNIQDPEARGTMIFAWWMACLCDAYASAYYRRKPVLDDEDYDIDFYTVDPIPPEVGESQTPLPSPREQLEVSISGRWRLLIFLPIIFSTDVLCYSSW